MRRTYVRRRLVAAALVLGALVVAVPAAANAVGGGAERPPEPVTYVVQPGDTLWSIAQRTAPTEDPRAVVDAIAVVNGLDDGALVPGQALTIPSG